MSDDALALILSKLQGIEATQEEQRRELAFIKGQQVDRDAAASVPVQVPRPATAGNGRFVHEVDGKPIDPRMRAEMWRNDAVMTCPCGSHRYAQTLSVVGEYDIIAAQRPVMDADTGAVARQPYRLVTDPNTGESTIPEALRLTPEVAEHFKACKAEASLKDVALQSELRSRISEMEQYAQSQYSEREGTERAVRAHMAAVHG